MLHNDRVLPPTTSRRPRTDSAPLVSTDTAGHTDATSDEKWSLRKRVLTIVALGALAWVPIILFILFLYLR